jgi:hypothetical protein
MGYNVAYNFTIFFVAQFVVEVAEIVFGGYRRKIGLGSYKFSYNT